MRSGVLQKRGLSIHEYLSANLLESVWDCSLLFPSLLRRGLVIKSIYLLIGGLGVV